MQDVLCQPASSGRAGQAPVGAALRFALDIPTTSGEDITAHVSLGQLSGMLTGKNRRGGHFSLTGQLPGPGGTIEVVEWNMRALRDLMEGVVGYKVTLDGVAGVGGVGARLSNVTRQ